MLHFEKKSILKTNRYAYALINIPAPSLISSIRTAIALWQTLTTWSMKYQQALTTGFPDSGLSLCWGNQLHTQLLFWKQDSHSLCFLSFVSSCSLPFPISQRELLSSYTFLSPQGNSLILHNSALLLPQHITQFLGFTYALVIPFLPAPQF